MENNENLELAVQYFTYLEKEYQIYLNAKPNKNCDQPTNEVCSQIIWQYVRSNCLYRSDYYELKDHPDRKILFLSKWKISKPMNPTHLQLPKDVYFNRKPFWSSVEYMKDGRQNVQRVTARINLEHEISKSKNAPTHAIVSVDLSFSKSAILEALNKNLINLLPDKSVTLPNRVHHQLVEYVACFYLKKLYSLKGKEINNRFKHIFGQGSSQQNNQINRKVIQFGKISAKSPQILINSI